MSNNILNFWNASYLQNPFEPISNMNSIYGFKPIIDIRSKILILGSMPSQVSLEKQEYYGYRHNAFWKIIQLLSKCDDFKNYQHKLDTLLNLKIALWDVCYSCVRPGSSDLNIRQEAPNDISQLIQQYPNIKAIFFNGKKAEQLFGKYFDQINRPIFYLPSTSPANARVSFSLKLIQWERLMKYIKD